MCPGSPALLPPGPPCSTPRMSWSLRIPGALYWKEAREQNIISSWFSRCGAEFKTEILYNCNRKPYLFFSTVITPNNLQYHHHYSIYPQFNLISVEINLQSSLRQVMMLFHECLSRLIGWHVFRTSVCYVWMSFMKSIAHNKRIKGIRKSPS